MLENKLRECQECEHYCKDMNKYPCNKCSYEERQHFQKRDDTEKKLNDAYYWCKSCDRKNTTKDWDEKYCNICLKTTLQFYSVKIPEPYGYQKKEKD